MKKDTNMDPMKVASNVYKFINENDRVRVLEVIFKPGDTAKMHHHPEHVVYVLKGGHLKLTSEGKTQELDLKQDQLFFSKSKTTKQLTIANQILTF